jgi:murein DD-endopeptidase MepM/ murein hydrolase activator NlpD
MRVPWPKRLSVIVVPEGGAHTYNFHIRTVLLIIVALVFLTLFILSVASMFSFGRLLVASTENLRLNRRIRLMEVELEKVRTLEAQLNQSEELRMRVLALLGAFGGELDSLVDSRELAVASAAQDELRLQEQNFLRSIPSSWPVQGPITRHFTSSKGGSESYHPGVDIAAQTGVPVRSAAGGTVIFAGPDEQYGNLVVIEHGMGLESRYAHNDRLNVQVGDRVQRGQMVASVGSTGNSTAPHLHFEIRKDGVPVDPLHYLD